MSVAATIAVDGHVHLYPAYSLPAALDALFATLGQYLPPDGDGGVSVGVLADTAAARAYRDRIFQPRPKQAGRFILQPTEDPAAMAVRDATRLLGYLVAGRQIVTAERLEVLALTVDLDVPDGRPLEATLAAIRDAGGIAVLSWSPGKWSGRRGSLVRDLVRSPAPAGILLGDTSLRPRGLAEPALIREARARGIRILQGTDPLPFAGDEARLGSWASLLRGPWDPARPAASLRALLASAGTPATAAGTRLSWPGFASRWLRLMLRKYAARP